MMIIRHRVNSVGELAKLASSWGAEIDLRSRGSHIVLNHEPFRDGDLFESFATAWKAGRHGGTLILNPKEDGLEGETLAILARHHIDDYFFLDLTIPTTVRLACKEGMGKVAVRVSEYETLESAMRFHGKAAWAWLDCFSGEPPARDLAASLKRKFKICLVSPELQGYPAGSITRFTPLKEFADAVCTKHPELWEKP